LEERAARAFASGGARRQEFMKGKAMALPFIFYVFAGLNGAFFI
jgi:hypothetical protein